MAEFMKTSDHDPHRLILLIFQLHNPPNFLLGEKDFQKNAVEGE